MSAIIHHLEETGPIVLVEYYDDEKGEKCKSEEAFTSKKALLKAMEKFGGYPSLCMYDLKKHNKHTGELFGMIRTLIIDFVPMDFVMKVTEFEDKEAPKEGIVLTDEPGK